MIAQRKRLSTVFTICSLAAALLLVFGAASSVQAKAREGNDLIQFSSGGHVLGFGTSSLIVASSSHMLKVSFQGGRATRPSGESGSKELSRVTYRGVWEGIDVVYEKTKGSIVKSTYTVSSGSPGPIRLRYNRPVSLDDGGNLVVSYDRGAIMESSPVAWQEVGGARRPVMVAWVLLSDHEAGFVAGDYDPAYPLVIDPSLTWNSFLGSATNDVGYGIAVDSSGNVYVAGGSDATWGSPKRAFAGGLDAFAAKLASDGSLTWNTFLGGGAGDQSYAIAVDSSGNVYVAGYSAATWGSPKRAYGAGSDAFAAKLASDGSLTWNTFLGGGDDDYGYGIAVDSSGNVYVAGWGRGTWGSPKRGYSAGYDAFAAQLASDGSLTWNTFLGSLLDDYGNGIAVDSSGNSYVTGYSRDEWGSPVRGYTAGSDAFAAKLASDGTLTWNTFLGGSGWDDGQGIAVDSSFNVYVAGYSDATWGTSPKRAYTSGTDTFAVKLASDGSLTWHTFLGGSGADYGKGIAVDSSGNSYVTGYSTATWGSPRRAYTSGDDAFAVKLASDGTLTWSSFLGGTGSDTGTAIAVDSSFNTYVAGHSDAAWGTSTSRAYAGGSDVFAAKIPADPTSVALMTFTGNLTGVSVLLAWETGSETNNAGFHIWKSESADGAYAKVTRRLIPAKGGPSTGAHYSYTDTEVHSGTTAFYKLQDLDNTGASTYHGPISVTVATPVLRVISPADGGAFPTAPPAFQWEAEGVSSVRLQFSKDPAFKRGVYTISRVLAGGAYTPGAAEWKNVTRVKGKSDVLYWRVWGKDSIRKNRTVVSDPLSLTTARVIDQRQG